jgi:hypothetical protein
MTYNVQEYVCRNGKNGRKIIFHTATNCEVEYDEKKVSKEVAMFALKRLIDRENK